MENGVAVGVQSRDDSIGRGAVQCASRVVARYLNRKRVGLGRAVQITDFDEPDLGGIVSARDRDFFGDAHLPNGPCLRAEPAAVADVSWQDFALDSRALTIFEQCGYARRGIECRDLAVLRRDRGRGLRSKHKPAMRVWAEGDHVT